jgi:hypothetical protein
MTTLKELAAMLDAATGPSRELDADLAEVVGLRIEREHYTRYTQEWAPYIYDWMGCNKHPLPRFTSSIDAALALVERLLPGAITVHAQQWKHPTYERPESWTWELSIYPRGRTTATYSPTAPLAILRALVAALISQEKNDD